MDSKVDIKELLKSGAHFGHRLSHWHPKMEPYIHSKRGGIYIINLEKTVEQLQSALNFVQSVVADDKQILFVGTKKHVRRVVKEAAVSGNMPYIVNRWFGGILTNFETIKKRVKRLQELEEGLESGELAHGVTKRELGLLREEAGKLNISVGGLKGMDELPGAIFVADLIADRTAVKEAKRLGIPVIGIADTNTDPSEIDYPIAANDDAVASVKLICELTASAAEAGRKQQKKAKPKPQEGANP